MKRLWVGALLALFAWHARAQDGEPLTGTLQTIAKRGTILLGVRDGAVPFAFRDRAGQPNRLFCRYLPRHRDRYCPRRLNRDLLEPADPAWQTGIRIQYVSITADSRLPSLLSGAIDLECGSTTANAERARTIAFSPVFFLAGTKLLVPIAASITSYRDLAGRQVAVSAGTTNAAVMHRLAGSVSPPIAVTETPDVSEAYDMLAAGKAQAMASDDILLSGLAATHADGGRFTVIGDYLSFEPYAIALRRDDPQLADLVRSSFERMASDRLALRALPAVVHRQAADRRESGVADERPTLGDLPNAWTARLGAWRDRAFRPRETLDEEARRHAGP